MEENPEYFVFNGAVDALTKAHAMTAKVVETESSLATRGPMTRHRCISLARSLPAIICWAL